MTYPNLSPELPDPSLQNPQNASHTPTAAAQPGTQPSPSDATGDTKGGGFCQQCGTALNEQTRRSVGGAVYCEPCLQARLNGAPAYTTVAQPYAPWPPVTGAGLPSQPNPVLAGLLGFVPGVGAMYNEQYTKGIAHLGIFSLLVVFSDTSPIFGLGIAGWEFYMALEAYHTARARRAGLPLPNPFGFNDLGERLGFGKGWSAPAPLPQGAAPFTPVQPAPSTSEPWPQPVQPVSFPSEQPTPSFSKDVYAGAAVPLAESAPPEATSRFPASAILLILLGFVFLLSTTGLFRRFSGEAMLGWSLIAFAGWLFLRRWREPAASGMATLGRVSRALQGTVWLLTVGILALLDTFNFLRWSRSWPIFLIVAGGLALITRLGSQAEFSAEIPADGSAYPAADSPR